MKSISRFIMPGAVTLALSGFLLTSANVRSASPPGDTKSRPNVLLILLDDTGFGQLSSFGGPYHTPNIERLAQRGLRYTSFHTTALCSPSRAALLTGRNHHSVNMATITETASSRPGYTGKMPDSAGTIAQVLKGVGYTTSIYGKWHLTPTPEVTTSGPFDRWPTHKGFDYFYGFQGADTSQWHPTLWENTKPLEPPQSAMFPGYHLTVDLADRATAEIARHAKDAKPFFLYFSTGAGHAPHHAPQEYIAKYKGKFDEGWDHMREAVFARQKQLGIVPANAVLSARPDSIRAWDSLSKDE
jgi:arylsulfatase